MNQGHIGNKHWSQNWTQTAVPFNLAGYDGLRKNKQQNPRKLSQPKDIWDKMIRHDAMPWIPTEVQHLFSIWEAIGSNPSMGKKKKSKTKIQHKCSRGCAPSLYLPYLPKSFSLTFRKKRHQGRRHLTWLLSLDTTLLHLDVSSPLKILLLTLLNQSPTLSTHKGFESLAPDTPFHTELLAWQKPCPSIA